MKPSIKNVIIFLTPILVTLTFATGSDLLSSNVRYNLVMTNSLGNRGIICSLMCEAPEPALNPNGRHYEIRSFMVPTAGKDAVLTACGLSGSDDGPLGSDKFRLSLVGAFVTERFESITVCRSPMGLEASVPIPWCIGSNKLLLDEKENAVAESEVLRVQVTGTMEDRDLVLSLCGKDKYYSFKWNHNAIMQGWVRLPKADPPKTEAQPLIGDLMRAEFSSQQPLDGKGNGFLVTMFVEEPLQNNKGSRGAYYYFVSQQTDGSDLKYLDCRPSADKNSVDNGAGADNPASKPSVHLSGPKYQGAKLVLKVGKDELRYVYAPGYDTVHQAYTPLHWTKVED